MLKFIIRIKLYLKKLPFIYVPYYYTQKFSVIPKRHLVNNDKNLCLEAFPSSATSYLNAILQHIRPDIEIAHHTHSIANIRLAFMHNIPIIVTMRNPINAIASTFVRFNNVNNITNLEEYIIRYIDFYSYVLNNINKIIIIPFQLIINDLNKTLKIISKETDIHFIAEDLDKIIEEVKTYMEIWNHEYGKGGKESLPNKEREIKKNKVISEIKNKDDINLAKSVYNNILQIFNQKYYYNKNKTQSHIK